MRSLQRLLGFQGPETGSGYHMWDSCSLSMFVTWPMPSTLGRAWIFLLTNWGSPSFLLAKYVLVAIKGFTFVRTHLLGMASVLMSSASALAVEGESTVVQERVHGCLPMLGPQIHHGLLEASRFQNTAHIPSAANTEFW